MKKSTICQLAILTLAFACNDSSPSDSATKSESIENPSSTIMDSRELDDDVIKDVVKAVLVKVYNWNDLWEINDSEDDSDPYGPKEYYSYQVAQHFQGFYVYPWVIHNESAFVKYLALMKKSCDSFSLLRDMMVPIINSNSKIPSLLTLLDKSISDCTFDMVDVSKFQSYLKENAGKPHKKFEEINDKEIPRIINQFMSAAINLSENVFEIHSFLK